MRTERAFPLLILFLYSLAIHAQETAKGNYSTISNVRWTAAGNTELHMDIYTPEAITTPLPVLLIFHGGGWLINDKSIMNEMAAKIATTGRYVVCNTDYRLLTSGQNTTGMHEIIEDAMGAVLWVKEHIATYGGDPSRVAVTGDSAGGHLAAMVVNGQEALGERHIDRNDLNFSPTYLPDGISAERVKELGMLNVQAAVLSYPAVDLYEAAKGHGPDTGFESSSNFFWQMGRGKARGIFGDSLNVTDHPHLYKKVSPIYTIPDNRELPPVFCHVGEKDDTTTPESIKAYAEALKAAGSAVSLKIYPGKPHAYLDSGSNEYLGTSFQKDAIEPIDDIIGFLNSVFYRE